MLGQMIFIFNVGFLLADWHFEIMVTFFAIQKQYIKRSFFLRCHHSGFESWKGHLSGAMVFLFLDLRYALRNSCCDLAVGKWTVFIVAVLLCTHLFHLSFFHSFFLDCVWLQMADRRQVAGEVSGGRYLQSCKTLSCYFEAILWTTFQETETLVASDKGTIWDTAITWVLSNKKGGLCLPTAFSSPMYNINENRLFKSFEFLINRLSLLT